MCQQSAARSQHGTGEHSLLRELGRLVIAPGNRAQVNDRGWRTLQSRRVNMSSERVRCSYLRSCTAQALPDHELHDVDIVRQLTTPPSSRSRAPK